MFVSWNILDHIPNYQTDLRFIFQNLPLSRFFCKKSFNQNKIRNCACTYRAFTKNVRIVPAGTGLFHDLEILQTRKPL